MKFDIDYNKAPLLVIWEATRACALACKHCRASAINQRHPLELNTTESKKLLDDTKAMGTPVFVFTGGDPLQREDLDELIRHGSDIGLRTGTIPASTDRLTQDRVQQLKDAGLDQMALSLDGSTPEKHDGFRCVPGSYKKVMEGAAWAREAGIPLQINTVFAQWNVNDFDAIAKQVEDLGVVFWEVFFLVPTGRGAVMDSCTAEQYEMLFEKMYKLSRKVPFIIKVTEAPHYRRYVKRAEAAERLSGNIQPTVTTKTPHPHAMRKAIFSGPQRPIDSRGGLRNTYPGVNSGKGFCFVDHIGGVYPSGFLPKLAGDVRDNPIYEIYRNSPIFKDLRNMALLKGKCGHCEFNNVCGGSRARAYAMKGDCLAEEPFCNYQPATTTAG